MQPDNNQPAQNPTPTPPPAAPNPGTSPTTPTPSGPSATTPMPTPTPATQDDDGPPMLSTDQKVTLQPVHNDVAPDPMTDPTVVARHANGTAIANTENETEQNASLVQPAPELLNQQPVPEAKKDNKQLILIITGAVILVLAIVITVIALM